MQKRITAVLICSLLFVSLAWPFAYTGDSGSTQISTNPGSGDSESGGSGASDAIRQAYIDDFEDSVEDYESEVDDCLENETDYEEGEEEIDALVQEANETMEESGESESGGDAEGSGDDGGSGEAEGSGDEGSSEDSGNSEGAEEGGAAGEKQEEKLPEACQEAIAENTEIQLETEMAAEAETAGDPVLINIGEYVRTDTDLFLRKSFNLNRTYRSQSRITGTFGLGWAGTIDQRILSGLVPEIETAIEECKNRKRKLEDYLLLLERKIYEKYRITDLTAWEDEIDLKIQKLNRLLEASAEPLQKGKQLELAFNIPGWDDRVLAAMEKLEEQINRLNHLKAVIPARLEVMEAIKKGIRREEITLSKLDTLKEKNRQHSRLNVKSDFEGTPDEWIFTGFDTITFIDEEGINHLCRWSETEENYVPENLSSKKIFRIQKTKDGEFVLKKKSGEIFYFSSSGLIEKITDFHGNYIQFLRDINGKVFLIKTSFGEEYSVSYIKNKISSITNKRDPSEKISFSFDGNKLKTVTDTYGDSITFSYNDFDRIESLTKDDGSTVQFKSAEETMDGKKLITETVNEEGFSEYFVFDTINRTTEYTDHDGTTTLYCFNEQNKTILQKSSDGNTCSFDYDDFGNLIYENYNGESIVYSYDLSGNLLQRLFSDGSTESFKYDEKGNLYYVKNRDSIEIEFSRDENGNVISAAVDGIIPYLLEYDNHGLLTKETFFGTPDIIREYFYDRYGNLVSVKCGDDEIRYTYDERNRTTSIVKNELKLAEIVYSGRNQKEKYFNGLEITSVYNSRKDLVETIEEDTVTGEKRITTYTYDKRHLPLSKKISDGEKEIPVWTKVWSPEGKLSKMYEYNPDSEQPHWFTDFEYSHGMLKSVSQYTDQKDKMEIGFSTSILNGNCIEEIFTDPLGYTSRRVYNPFGQVTEYTDENGTTYERIFSKTGRLLSDTNKYGGITLYEYDPFGNITSVKEKNRGLITEKNSFDFSPDGRMDSSTDASGEKTEYFYNSEGQVIQIISSEGNLFYEYDNYGRTKAIIAGTTTSRNDALYYVDYEYSKDGRELKISYSGLYSERYFTDAFGRVNKIEYPDGNFCSYTYDMQGNLASSTDFYGNKTTYSYDGKGNLIRTGYPDGTFCSYEYDINGNCTKASDDEGVFEEKVFDKKGFLIREKGRNIVPQEYEYDKTGKLLYVYSGTGRQLVESYVYKNQEKTLECFNSKKNVYSCTRDDFGNIITEKNRLGVEKHISYDAENRISQLTDFNETNIRFEFKPLSRSVFYPDNTVKFKYDFAGNILEAENDLFSFSFSYDQCGLLKTISDNKTDETVSYSYDACGRRSRVSGYGRDINYTYGKNGEVLEIFDKITKQKVSFRYDVRMRETRRTFSNGVFIETSYDKAGRISSVAERNSEGTLLFAEGYVYGEDGRRCGTVNQDGLVTLYEYDSLGQVSCVRYPATDDHIEKIKAEKILLQLDSEDDASITETLNLTAKQTEPYLKAMENFSDNPAVSSQQKIITERYAYDLNGNRTERMSPLGKMTYSYDKENRLQEIKAGGKTVYSYSYDSNGNLLEETNPASKKQYVWSSANRMTSFKEFREGIEISCSFFYDPFNRKVLETSSSGSSVKTVYDGFSFDSLKRGLIYGNGFFTDSYRTTYQSAESIPDDDNRYHFMPDSLMPFENPSFAESLPLNFSGKIVCRLNGLKEEFEGTDILGTIRNTTDETGNINRSFSYDVFGAPLSSDLSDYGFCGKPYNSDSELYDFGFRDLHPGTSRFMSVDPVRDGDNWYSYCMNDPLNFFDMWGLCSAEAFIQITEKEDFNGMPSSVRSKMYKQLYNQIETKKFTDILRNTIGAKYSHLRKPTASEMDCSGAFVYAMDEMGYEVDNETTVAKIVAGMYPGVKMFNEVKQKRQGLAGILNFYHFTDYFDHMNYGVGQEEGENENQIIDASYNDLKKTDTVWWQDLRNKNPRQLVEAKKNTINKTYAPFSYNTAPLKQGYIDFTKFFYNKERKESVNKKEEKPQELNVNVNENNETILSNPANVFNTLLPNYFPINPYSGLWAQWKNGH